MKDTTKLSNMAKRLHNMVLTEICENPETSESNASAEYVLAETTKLLSQELSMWLWSNLPNNQSRHN